MARRDTKLILRGDEKVFGGLTEAVVDGFVRKWCFTIVGKERALHLMVTNEKDYNLFMTVLKKIPKIIDSDEAKTVVSDLENGIIATKLSHSGGFKSTLIKVMEDSGKNLIVWESDNLFSPLSKMVLNEETVLFEKGDSVAFVLEKGLFNFNLAFAFSLVSKERSLHIIAHSEEHYQIFLARLKTLVGSVNSCNDILATGFEKGVRVFKFSRKGGVHPTHIRITHNGINFCVAWESDSLYADISQLVLTKTTILFEHGVKGAFHEHKSLGIGNIDFAFSLEFPERSLDLVASNKEDYDRFINFFKNVAHLESVSDKRQTLLPANASTSKLSQWTANDPENTNGLDTGHVLIKFSRRGGFHATTVSIHPTASGVEIAWDADSIIWSASKMTLNQDCVLHPGGDSFVFIFDQDKYPFKMEYAFSIVGTERCLDLIAPSKEIYDLYINALSEVVKIVKPAAPFIKTGYEEGVRMIKFSRKGGFHQTRIRILHDGSNYILSWESESLYNGLSCLVINESTVLVVKSEASIFQAAKKDYTIHTNLAFTLEFKERPLDLVPQCTTDYPRLIAFLKGIVGKVNNG